jgi:signal peptidase I
VTPDPNDPALAVEEPPVAGPPDVESPPAAPADKPGSTRWIKEAAVVVVVAVLVAVLLRAFVVQTFFIPSGSMEPTLQIGDRILVNKLSYHLHGVDRGDIVVFSRPPAENCGGPEVNDLVKRVIGLPGDVVSLTNGYVYIDGKRLNESWLPSSEQGITVAGPAGNDTNLARPYRVPTNDYFVMGDNRTDSCDSRYWGPISRSLIVGKVELRVWPLSSLHIF